MTCLYVIQSCSCDVYFSFSFSIAFISVLFIRFQEISFDVFLQVIWEDKRIHHRNTTAEQKYIELKLEERHKLWVTEFDL